MAESLIKKLKGYYKYLKQQRDPLDTGWWKDIGENLIPDWEEFDIERKASAIGQKKARKIYNSSPSDNLNTFADGFHGNIINQSMDWFMHRLPRRFAFLEDVPQVRAYLQAEQEHTMLAFQNSNFYTTMRRYFKTAGSIGTSTKYIEEDMTEGKILFHMLHPREVYIAENKYGEIDTVFRSFMMTARSMKQRFGEENLSKSVKEALKNNPFSEFHVINAVYPNDEFDDRILANRFKRFASKWFEFSKVDNEKDMFLRESGHDTFPYKIWRYFRGENSPYGESPGLYALPEIMGLQAMGKTLLRAGHVSVNPSVDIPSEWQGQYRGNPGGVNYYGPDYQRRAYPSSPGVNYPIGLDRETNATEIIKRHFHVPFFEMLESITKTMTAREISERIGEKATKLSASVGDLTPILDADIDEVRDIERKAGRSPVPPQILVDFMGGMRIPVEYMGPLAQTQKRVLETRGAIDGLDLIAPYFELYPNMRHIVNELRTGQDILKSYGFPQVNFNTPEEIAAIIESEGERAALEVQKSDLERMSEALKDLGQADKNFQGKMFEKINAILDQSGAVPVPGAVPLT